MKKIICLEWSNMPYKHDIVFFTNKFRTLDPHPPTVYGKVLNKYVFFGCLPLVSITDGRKSLGFNDFQKNHRALPGMPECSYR